MSSYLLPYLSTSWIGHLSDKCELTIQRMQSCIKWISGAAVEAMAKFQILWIANPSGTTAFHFPGKILLTRLEYVFFCLLFWSLLLLFFRKKKKKKKAGKSRVEYLFHYRGLNHPVKDKVYSRNLWKKHCVPMFPSKPYDIACNILLIAARLPLLACA